MLKKILPPRLVPFLHFLAPYKKLMALGILSLLATDALTMVIPWLLKTVIDLLPGKPSGEVLARYAGWLILTALGLGVGRYGWRQYFFGSSRRIEVDIQNRLFSHLLDLDAVYFQSQRTGDLMSRATNDLRAVRDFLGLGLLILVDAVAVMAASISLMFYIQPKLAFFCLLPLPLVSVIFLKFLKASGLRHKAIQESLARITHRVQENLAGIRILHAFVQEEHEKRRFDTLNREHIRENLALAGIFGLFTASLSFTMGVVAMISLWLGGKAVIAGSMTLGAFVAFNGYLMLLAWPMMAVGYIINLTQKGLTAMERLQEIFQARSSLKPVGGTASSMVLRGGLEFENAGFHYDGAAEAALRGATAEDHDR
ncbi:MAG: ABC transporter transmembrane domain-containing protein, partial [Nitrospinaceae bacterium]